MPRLARAQRGECHSSRPFVTDRLKQPTRTHGRAARIPSWPCSGGGLPGRPRYRGRRCALTAPFQSHRFLAGTLSRRPSTTRDGTGTFGAADFTPRAGVLLPVALFLQLALTGRYPASCPMELRLSSRGLRHRRHSGRLRPSRVLTRWSDAASRAVGQARVLLRARRTTRTGRQRQISLPASDCGETPARGRCRARRPRGSRGRGRRRLGRPARRRRRGARSACRPVRTGRPGR